MKKIILLTLFLVLAQGTSRAAIVEVPSQRAQRSSNSSPATLDFSNNVTAGNLLCIAGAAYDGGGITTFNVSDSRSTVYTTYVSNPGGTINGFLACGKALTSGANTVTVQPDALDTYVVYAIDEFTGQDTTTFLDVDGGSAIDSTTTPTIDVTTSVANAMILAVETDYNGTQSITEAGGWTLIGEEEDGATYVHFSFIFQIVTTGTTYTASWTIVSAPWSVYAISVKPRGVVGGGLTQVIVVE